VSDLLFWQQIAYTLYTRVFDSAKRGAACSNAALPEKKVAHLVIHPPLKSFTSTGGMIKSSDCLKERCGCFMAGKIVIDVGHCKGCGVCVATCPKDCIAISGQANAMGYFPAEFIINGSDACIGCALCAIVCPDAAIMVYRDDCRNKAASRENIEGRK
jgi:2-oxoglutarate ferredoxin oxidoreductase subunit delta